jgi:DNA (cytosine-5)-methyltransferase 1
VEWFVVTVGSLFSGIGGIDLGLERAGMKVVWQVENNEFCRKALRKHWPGVKLYGDIREIQGNELEPVDLICGGFPCQDLSVAGKRAGLAGERSGLFYEFTRIIDELSPRWVLIENVPGLLSSNGGRDMGAVLGTLAELGYGYAYRVLDAQFFGVAQRRRRVFIVGCLGDASSAAKVLFEPESCPRGTPPSKKKRSVSATLSASGAGTSRTGGQAAEPDFLVSHSLKASGGFKQDHTHETYIPKSASRVYTSDVTNTLRAGAGMPKHDADNSRLVSYLAPTLTASNNPSRSPQSSEVTRQIGAVNKAIGTVRRLTPTECERLQGFPDGWTAIDGEDTPDSPRYKALGNAVCVNVAEWIGRRIIREESA